MPAKKAEKKPYFVFVFICTVLALMTLMRGRAQKAFNDCGFLRLIVLKEPKAQKQSAYLSHKPNSFMCQDIRHTFAKLQ